MLVGWFSPDHRLVARVLPPAEKSSPTSTISSQLGNFICKSAQRRVQASFPCESINRVESHVLATKLGQLKVRLLSLNFSKLLRYLIIVHFRRAVMWKKEEFTIYHLKLFTYDQQGHAVLFKEGLTFNCFDIFSC